MKSQERESEHVLSIRALGYHWGCENRSPLYRNLLFDNGRRYSPNIAYLSMYYLNEKISFKWGGEGGKWGKGMVRRDERCPVSYTAKPEPQSYIASLSTWSKRKRSKELTKRIRTHCCYRLKEIPLSLEPGLVGPLLKMQSPWLGARSRGNIKMLSFGEPISWSEYNASLLPDPQPPLQQLPPIIPE